MQCISSIHLVVHFIFYFELNYLFDIMIDQVSGREEHQVEPEPQIAHQLDFFIRAISSKT
jgi:hypothetical protein